jgi:N-acetyl-gamma-glutamylphosphate reductase
MSGCGHGRLDVTFRWPILIAPLNGNNLLDIEQEIEIQLKLKPGAAGADLHSPNAAQRNHDVIHHHRHFPDIKIHRLNLDVRRFQQFHCEIFSFACDRRKFYQLSR